MNISKCIGFILPIIIGSISLIAEDAEPIRPLIFHIRSGYFAPGGEDYSLPYGPIKVLDAAISQCIEMEDFNHPGRLAPWIKNIVLYETNKFWVVACFDEHNGKIGRLGKDGTLYEVLQADYSHSAIIKIDHETLEKLENNDENGFRAYSMPIILLNGLEPLYPDATEIEKVSREKRYPPREILGKIPNHLDNNSETDKANPPSQP